MAKATDPSVIAQNRRKVEKDKRRKAYHDSQVQVTNDFSIVSKRLVEKIYNPVLSPDTTCWFECVVPKGKRRSPPVNRIFWIRMECIKQAVKKIAVQYPSRSVCVVNLGCGFDVLSFELLEHGHAFTFLDFDYPEVVSRKADMIRKSSKILQVTGPEIEVEANVRQLGVEFASSAYKLVACDLNDASKYAEQQAMLIGGADVTIFIAEVSLAYMTPAAANQIIQYCASVQNCHFLALEQILPSGRNYFFAEKMLHHFSHLNSPLQCVEEHPTKQLQQNRFRKIFQNAEVIDMLEAWNQLVSRERKALVALIEEFDEWEELILYCHHYAVVHATNSKCIFSTAASHEPLPLSALVKLEPLQTSLEIESRFLAACVGTSGIYIHGGISQTRHDTLRLVQSNQITALEADPKPLPRMAHCMINLENGNLLLLGGRTRPGFNLSDIWLFNEASQKWKLLGTMPRGISRHSAVCSAPGIALVFADGKFFRVSTNELDVCAVSSNVIPNIKSCGMVYDRNTQTGYVVGGMQDDLEPTFGKMIYKFVYDLASNDLLVEPFLESAQFGRVGCLTKLIGLELYIIGGVGYTPTTQTDTVIKVCLATKEIFAVPIEDCSWNTLPVLTGAQLSGDLLVGGGAVCYTFGDSYSKVYRVHF